MNSAQTSQPTAPKAHQVTIIACTGLADIPEAVICEALRRIPQWADLPSRKCVIACTKLTLAAERALLEDEDVKREKPRLLVHLIKGLRKLGCQRSGSGETTSDYPIHDPNAN
jgi:hypothetical protein